jgi:hypothetical protein
MTELKIRWVQQKLQFQSGKDAYVGKVKIGCVVYDSLTSREQKEKYAAICKLPGIKADLGHFFTEDKAQKKLEAVWLHWVGMLNQELVV